MARPKMLTTSRAKPFGQLRRIPSVRRITPTVMRPRRIRGIRPTREFAQAREVLVEPPNQEDTFEMKYQEWLRTIGGSSPAAGNRAEFTCWLFLVERKKQKPGIDFEFLSPQLGGRQHVGGAVADFVIPARFLIWRVQGEAFHIVDPSIRAKDALQKIALTESGWRVIDIFTADLAQQRTRVLEAAWEGIQVTFLQTI